jgi:hypothetical protein
MENPPAPVPGDKPNGEAEAGLAPKPFPPFKPADDGVKDVHMEADGSPAIGTHVAKGKEFGSSKADARSLGELSARTPSPSIESLLLERASTIEWRGPLFPGLGLARQRSISSSERPKRSVWRTRSHLR